MIRYLKHTDINKVAWDDCINRAINGSIYAYSWYLDIVAEVWDALVEDDYVRVMPLPIRTKLGYPYIYQPFFVQQLGVYSVLQLSSLHVNAFYKAIPEHIKLIYYNLNVFNSFDDLDFVSEPWVTYEMDLIAPYNDLFKRYSDNAKRNLKKAQGLTINTSERPDLIIDIFRQNKGKEVAAWGDAEYAILKKLIYSCIHKEKAAVWSCYDETNTLCAGIFFVISHGKVIFLFSGTNTIAKEKQAMTFMIDTFIKQHAGRQLTLDFEGSNNPDLARFYKGFGSSPVYYKHIETNMLPKGVKIGYDLIKSLRTLLNKKII